MRMGPPTRAPRPTSSTTSTSGAGADHPPLRRGAVRLADRARHRRGARAKGRSPAPATSSRPCAGRSRRRPSSAPGHPAKRVFQALRIVVNDELGALEDGLAVRARDAHARAAGWAVISFHSLEDRIVKTFFARRGARLHLPARSAGLRLRARAAPARADAAGGPPDEIEVEDNPRAASARLRVAERTAAERARMSAVPAPSRRRRGPSSRAARGPSAPAGGPAAYRPHPRRGPCRVVLELRDRRDRRRCCCAASSRSRSARCRRTSTPASSTASAAPCRPTLRTCAPRSRAPIRAARSRRSRAPTTWCGRTSTPTRRSRCARSERRGTASRPSAPAPAAAPPRARPPVPRARPGPPDPAAPVRLRAPAGGGRRAGRLPAGDRPRPLRRPRERRAPFDGRAAREPRRHRRPARARARRLRPGDHGRRVRAAGGSGRDGEGDRDRARPRPRVGVREARQPGREGPHRRRPPGRLRGREEARGAEAPRPHLHPGGAPRLPGRYRHRHRRHHRHRRQRPGRPREELRRAAARQGRPRGVRAVRWSRPADAVADPARRAPQRRSAGAVARPRDPGCRRAVRAEGAPADRRADGHDRADRPAHRRGPVDGVRAGAARDAVRRRHAGPGEAARDRRPVRARLHVQARHGRRRPRPAA